MRRCKLCRLRLTRRVAPSITRVRFCDSRKKAMPARIRFIKGKYQSEPAGPVKPRSLIASTMGTETKSSKRAMPRQRKAGNLGPRQVSSSRCASSLVRVKPSRLPIASNSDRNGKKKQKEGDAETEKGRKSRPAPGQFEPLCFFLGEGKAEPVTDRFELRSERKKKAEGGRCRDRERPEISARARSVRAAVLLPW